MSESATLERPANVGSLRLFCAGCGKRLALDAAADPQDRLADGSDSCGACEGA